MIALLYDVHANRPALEAVLADARAQGADHCVLGGDYSLFGPEPEGTVELLRTLAPAMWIRGNGERWTAQPADRRVEHRRLPYDHAAAAARMRERRPGAEWAGTVARRIEQARRDV